MSVRTTPDSGYPTTAPRRLGRRGAAIAGVIALMASGVGAATANTGVVEKNTGGIVDVGPVNGDNGFPAWYEDKNGVRLEPCLNLDNPLCGFLPGDVPDDTQPISFPDNFPEEHFYFLSGSDLDLPGGGRAVLTLGLEGVYSGATPNDQMVFARQRIVVKGGPADTTLTFKEPYGVITVDTDAGGDGRFVEDISPAVGNFTTAFNGNLGPWLKWDPAVGPAAPEGYLGDPGQEHKVVGSPKGFNAFSVTGGGLDLSTDLFTVQGKISTNTGVNADSAVLNGDMIDVFASSQGTQLQVEGQDGKFETTPMITDPGSNRFYARVHYTGEAPTSVKVVNIGDDPVSSSTVPVKRASGILVTRADYDGTKLTVQASSTNGYPVIVKGLGELSGPAAQEFTVTAPPSSVTVSNTLGSDTLPVTITGGVASPVALPPVDPEPDPGPVDPTAPPAAVITAAAPSVARGANTQLDGSTSTGAVSYQWSQVSGPQVTFSATDTAKTTVSVPMFTSATATQPVPAQPTGPATIKLVVTNAANEQSSTTFDLAIVDGTVSIDAGSRHRLGKEFRVSGTVSPTGTLAPGTQVLVFDNTPGRAVTKLGNAPVDTLGVWTYKPKPGPSRQVTSVLVQSTRGGTATSAVATR
jgi:hypothetical protein